MLVIVIDTSFFRGRGTQILFCNVAATLYCFATLQKIHAYLTTINIDIIVMISLFGCVTVIRPLNIAKQYPYSCKNRYGYICSSGLNPAPVNTNRNTFHISLYLASIMVICLILSDPWSINAGTKGGSKYIVTLHTMHPKTVSDLEH
jgi:hypothetical protein